MRLKVNVLEGDETRTHLVPLATVLAYRKEHGKTVNETIREEPINDTEWGAWLAWHTEKHYGDPRDFDQWSTEVEWVEVDNEESDPSGGETATSTGTGSPSSLRKSARSRSSSDGPKTSKPESGGD